MRLNSPQPHLKQAEWPKQSPELKPLNEGMIGMDLTQKTTTEELIAFFTEVSTQDNCPSCGHEDFTVCSSSDLGAWTYAQGVLNSSIVTLEYKVFCEKCGYIRSHNAMVVDNWVKLRRESQASEVGAQEAESDNGL